jgi:uncharacterized protein (DUF433 family)
MGKFNKACPFMAIDGRLVLRNIEGSGWEEQMDNEGIVGAFGEEDAARLTGLTVGQLRSWERNRLLSPSYAIENRRFPYSRVYSFRDIVSLRVLASLRLQHGVSVQHLRKVSDKLSHLGEKRWTVTTLYVLGKKVVFDDPNTLKRQEVVSGQRVFDIPLRVAIRSTRDAIRQMNERQDGAVGHVVSERFLMNNRPVFEGTRIPVAAVISYLERGAQVSEIIKEYPDLQEGDIAEARKRMRANAA